MGKPLLPAVKDFLVEHPLRLCDNHGADRVSRDVQAGSGHAEDAVHAEDDSDCLDRESDLIQNHCEGDHRSAGHTRRADGGKGRHNHDGDNFPRAEVNSVSLCNKHGGHRLGDGRSVHVDGAAERNREGADLRINAAFFGDRLQCDRKRRVAARGRESDRIDIGIIFEELERADPHQKGQHAAVGNAAQ